MKNNFSNYLTHQNKKIAWKRFDFFGGSKPPSTSDGKKYVCINLLGDMQVCVWDGVTGEWIYCEGSKVTDEHIKAVAESVSDAALDVILKHAPGLKNDYQDISENIYEMALEHKHGSVSYFDFVEWYIELPDAPIVDEITVEEGDEIQAAVFEQEWMLLDHLEKAVKEYVSAKSKIVKVSSNAP